MLLFLVQFPICVQLGAKLPLYAFKKVNDISSGKGLFTYDNKEPPVAFLDSLLLGEVTHDLAYYQILCFSFIGIYIYIYIQ